VAAPVIVYSALAHPLDGRPGIAYARESPRLVAARALDVCPAGKTGSQTKAASVSMQDQQAGAQEPESPDKPQEPTIPGEPGTTPDEPSPAPDAPTMPEDPDLAPPASPEESSNS
jgi:hypothetical protein